MNQTNLNIMKALRIIFLIIIMVGCTKENSNYKSVGTIAGYDHTMCGCCGGWIINIDDVVYLIDSMLLKCNYKITKTTAYLQPFYDYIIVVLKLLVLKKSCHIFNNMRQLKPSYNTVLITTSFVLPGERSFV